MSGSLLLGLASVGVLIYFIHHLGRSIQIDAIMSQVEREARWVIDDLYSQQPDYLAPERRCPDPPASATVLPAGRSGYIQAVQPEPLVGRPQTRMWSSGWPGRSVTMSWRHPLAWAWPGCPSAHLSASSWSGRRPAARRPALPRRAGDPARGCPLPRFADYLRLSTPRSADQGPRSRPWPAA